MQHWAMHKLTKMVGLPIGLLMLLAILTALGCSGGGDQNSDAPAVDNTAETTPADTSMEQLGNDQTNACVAGETIDATNIRYQVVNNENTTAVFNIDETLRGVDVMVDIATSEIEGGITRDGSAEFMFDLHTLESDQPNRDRYIRTQLFEAEPHIARVTVPAIFGASGEFTAEQAEMRALDALLHIQDPLGTALEVEQTYELTIRHDCDTLFLLATTMLNWDSISREPPSSLFFTVTSDIRVQVRLELEQVN